MAVPNSTTTIAGFFGHDSRSSHKDVTARSLQDLLTPIGKLGEQARKMGSINPSPANTEAQKWLNSLYAQINKMGKDVTASKQEATEVTENTSSVGPR